MLTYKRILLKVSGESLADESHAGISQDRVKRLAQQIKKVVDLGAEVGVVVGGGNFWRGRLSCDIDRGVSDYVGMMATVMNSLVLGEALKEAGVDCKVLSALAMDKVAEPYLLSNALRYMDEGKTLIFAAGTGLPYFSTDTTAALRACEIHADAIFCAKNIDGVYDDDPKVNGNAKKIDHLTYDEVIAKNLKALDLTAVAMCREFDMPILIFGIEGENCIVKAVCGENIGTIIRRNS